MQIQNIAFNESAIPGRYPMTYRVRDVEKGFPARTFDVLATRDEIDFLAREGYLIRERLIPMAQVEILRAALDECVARDQHLETMGGRKFGGIFIRYLMDKHPAFLGFLKFQPTLSIARAMFGSMVQLRGFVGRVVYPTSEHSETVWHFHQRLIPDPLPPWLARPQTLDVLLYLDDLTDENGPLCIMPQSHNCWSGINRTMTSATCRARKLLRCQRAVWCFVMARYGIGPCRPGRAFSTDDCCCSVMDQAG